MTDKKTPPVELDTVGSVIYREIRKLLAESDKDYAWADAAIGRCRARRITIEDLTAELERRYPDTEWKEPTKPAPGKRGSS